MARRMTAILLCLCVLVLCGCQMQPDSAGIRKPVKFYYKVNQPVGTQAVAEQAVDCEQREAAGHETDYRWLLDAYFEGPSQENLVAPFPKSTTLRAAALDNGTMYVDVSKDLAELTGIDLTLACSCIFLTCMEFDGVQAVSITANGESMDGKQMITLSAEDLFLEDQSGYDTTSTYLLYFSDTDNRYLITEEVRLEDDVQHQERQLLEQLIQGPKEAGLAQTIPLDTEILNLEVDSGLCSVNLSSAFLNNAPKTELAQRMTVLSITNTLAQLDTVNAVVVYVEGQRLEHYGAMNLKQPLTFEEGAVGPARTSLNERDADLYLYIGDNVCLSQIPVRVRQSADKLAGEQVLEQLLSYGEQNGYSSHIPAGTAILSVTMESDTCVVVLSKEMAQAEQLPLAIYSVCATVLAAGEYGSVQVEIEDFTPSPEQQELFGTLQWKDLLLSEGVQE